MKSSAGLILGTFLGLLLLVGVARGCTDLSYYKNFQSKDGNVYATGTYDDAKRVVDLILQYPDFKWIGEEQAWADRGDASFHCFDIEYKKVSMKLPFRDYLKYQKYLTKKFKEYIPRSEVPAPWK